MCNEDKTRVLFLQLVLLLFVSWVSAQTETFVSGRVHGEGEVLVGAHVTGASNLQLIAVTDIQGNFSGTTTDSIIVISMLGYDSLYVVAKPETGTIYLSRQTGILNQVVISESRKSGLLKESTVSIDLIQPKLIELTAPTDIEQSINRVNGVQIIDGQANIRSGSGWSYGAGSRVQVLVNGLPMLSGDASQALWSFIPTEGIESVEIIKGAASVIYGSSALNGVINIRTKTSGPEPLTHLSLSTGTYDLPARASLRQSTGRTNISNLSIFHLGKIGTMDFHLGMNMLYDGGFKMSDNERRGRTSFGLRKVLPDKQMTFGLNSAYQEGLSQSFLLWDSYGEGYTSLDSGITESKTTRIHIDPYWTWNHRGWKHQIKWRYLKVSNKVDNGNSTVDQSNYSDLVYGEYQLNRRLEVIQADLIGGLVGQFSKTESPLFSGEQRTSNAAAYLQLEKKMNRLILLGGLRYEYFRLNSREEQKPVFRAGANYRVSKAGHFRLSYGQGFRFPSVAETYVTTSVGPVSIYPNPGLQPEFGSNLEFGFKQGFQIKKLRGMFDLAIYEMQFDNMTEFSFAQWGEIVPPLFGAGFKSINAGKVKIQGMEISAVFDGAINKLNIQGFAGYNYTLPVSLEPDLIIAYDNSGTPITYENTSSNSTDRILKYRAQHQFKADIILEYKKFYVGYGIAYLSEMVNIDTAFISGFIEAYVPGIDSAMQLQLSSFLLHNIRFGYTVNKRLKLNLIVSNIFNREYMIRPADLGPPRTIRLQISYTLKAGDS